MLFGGDADGSRTLKRSDVGDGACCGAVAVNAIGARAQTDNALLFPLLEMDGRAQDKFLIAPSLPRSANRADDFASRKQTDRSWAMTVSQHGRAFDMSLHHGFNIAFDQVVGNFDNQAVLIFGNP